jgi:DNA-directed RNA polymerase specialized sigma24 family protein
MEQGGESDAVERRSCRQHRRQGVRCVLPTIVESEGGIVPDWEELIDRLRRRDRAAQMSIYEAYHQPLYLILLKTLPPATIHHRDCVENGIVDALRELFDRPEIFDPTRGQSSNPLLTLLVGMARRRTVDCLRRLKKDVLTREPLQSLDEDYLTEGVGATAQLGDGADSKNDDDPVNSEVFLVSNGAAVADAIEALVIGHISADEFYVRVLIHVEFRLLDELVARLKPKQFVAWFMKYFADLPVRDIARILELTAPGASQSAG